MPEESVKRVRANLNWIATKKMLTEVRYWTKSKWDLVKPEIKMVGDFQVEDAQDKANPPTFNYAIINLKIDKFDLNCPPLLKIYDEQTNQLLETIKIAPTPKKTDPKPLDVPIFLSYDKDPLSNTDKEPKSRITRIELHMPALNYVQVAYAKLKEGVFVVPVYWHNITDKSQNWKVFVDPMQVIDLFWRAPTGLDFNCVNSIWAQADIQFRLINTSVPFILSYIPAHYLKDPYTSYSLNCAPSQNNWTLDNRSPNGVDIFAIYKLKVGDDEKAVGCGNCWSQGHILIRAGNPNQSSSGFASSGFTDDQRNEEGRAIMVAHEFGHYLGGLGHRDDLDDNLMTTGLNGPKLLDYQIDQTRNFIKNRGYNEKK